jgi:hypothetical protein
MVSAFVVEGATRASFGALKLDRGLPDQGRSPRPRDRRRALHDRANCTGFGHLRTPDHTRVTIALRRSGRPGFSTSHGYVGSVSSSVNDRDCGPAVHGRGYGDEARGARQLTYVAAAKSGRADRPHASVPPPNAWLRCRNGGDTTRSNCWRLRLREGLSGRAVMMRARRPPNLEGNKPDAGGDGALLGRSCPGLSSADRVRGPLPVNSGVSGGAGPKPTSAARTTLSRTMSVRYEPFGRCAGV